MGFESFRVELRGGPASHARANEVVRQIPYVKPDREAIPSSGSRFYVVEDGLHVIEIEVADSPVKVSCRFTLSHPPSVDDAFLNLVREIMTLLGMEATICDDVRPEHVRGFSTAQFSEFAAILSDYVAKRRTEWAANFGGGPFPAKTSEVYEKLILPKCVPGAARTGIPSFNPGRVVPESVSSQ